jgi:hypothetical protein
VAAGSAGDGADANSSGLPRWQQTGVQPIRLLLLDKLKSINFCGMETEIVMLK